MAWTARQALGVAEMDATHREFMDLLDALLLAVDADFPRLFAALRQHTQQHFEQEKRWMKACRFPAIGEHEREHLRVLGELMHFGRGVAQGRFASARIYLQSLPGWFDTHLATMDSALAACLKQQAASQSPA